MTTIAEKIAALPPINLSSIVFEDDEDEYECPSSTSSASSPAASPHMPSPMSSSSSIPSTKTTQSRKLLEPTDRSTDFFWPMGIRPLELRGPFYNVHQAFLPNNNDIDEILNGPRGEMAPSSRPPNTSPKWDWEPTMTMMRHVWTMGNEPEPTDRSTDSLGPMGIWTPELQGLPPSPPPSPSPTLEI